MAKKIKHVSELPAWFKLEKYAFTSNLDAAGWYEQLNMRCICLYQIAEHTSNKTQPPKGLKAAIQTLRENPNSNILRDKKLEEYFPYGSNLLHLLDPQTNTDKLLGITRITTNNLFNNSYKTRESKNTDLLAINLSLPDSFLIENFKQYLSARRKEKRPTYKHFRESDFNSWSKLGVLPYLDLVILEYETNSRIPNRIFADALYPSGEKGEETIRKTIVPLGNQLLSFYALHQLSAQAALEIAEKNES